jgi:phosphoserine phosphatase RsbU/P
MKSTAISPSLRRPLQRQQLLVVIAVVIYAMFWAIGQPAPLSVTLLYSLCLGNFTFYLLDRLEFLHGEKRGAKFPWLTYLILLLALTPLAVFLATTVVFWMDMRSGGGHFQLFPRGKLFWDYQRTSWKFPAIANIIVAIVMQLFLTSKSRLEQRNRELQRSVQFEIAHRELQEQELQRAREIQQELLPKDIPQIEGFEIAGAWEPARIVGGDYFDVIKLSDGKLAVCIADVVGKSVSAALLMANVQATVRAFASESAPPSWLCSRVNSVLCSNIASGKFVTLFYGVLDAERQTLQYTSAGHSRPILIRASGAAERLENGGALLGVFPDWKYEDSSVQLAAGDRLLLFTDGITEAAKPDGEEFGEERLVGVANTARDATPAELNAQLLKHVKGFCNAQLQDDATLVVIAVAAARAAIRPELAAVSS